MNQTFRPRSNYIWAGSTFILVGLFAANSIFVFRSGVQTIVELAVCFAIAVLAHLVWIRPKMVLQATSVYVVNPITSIEIPYNEILELETKWSLSIIHRSGRTRVWVAPASGKRRWIADKTFGFYGKGIMTANDRGTDSETMSASLDSLSGQAAYMIREKMKRLH